MASSESGFDRMEFRSCTKGIYETAMRFIYRAALLIERGLPGSLYWKVGRRSEARLTRTVHHRGVLAASSFLTVGAFQEPQQRQFWRGDYARQEPKVKQRVQQRESPGRISRACFQETFASPCLQLSSGTTTSTPSFCCLFAWVSYACLA